MEFLLLWTLTSIAVLNSWIVHGTVPIPVLHFEEKIIEGEETSIRCTLPYTETEEAELSIKMGNFSLPDCTQKKGIYPNITCNMEVTPEMHETEFTCEAQFKSYSKPAKMMILTEPEFTDCPEKVVWVEGQETSFHCKAKGYPAPVVTCGTNISTYKDGEKFTAAKNMSGIYICTAKNDDMVTKTVTVSVEYKPHILSIDIAPSLHGEGDKVTLTCQADGLPEPTYSWNVPSSNVTFSPNNQTVTVENLQKSQLGNYECIAHNQHGTATRENVLELVAKPKILEITAQPSTQVLEGDNVTLTCEASGFPPPVFGWETPNANVEYSQDRRTVTIWQVKKNNMGQYRCKAENAHGVDTQVLQLTLAVKASVTAIKVKPSNSVEEGANVTLTCQAEGIPPPEYNWETPTPDVTYSSDHVAINIWGATKMHEGVYRCIARNKHGTHNQTTKISVKVSKKSDGNRGERREPVFATIFAALNSMILFYYLC